VTAVAGSSNKVGEKITQIVGLRPLERSVQLRDQGHFHSNSGVFSLKYCGRILMYSQNTCVFCRIPS
jgi:hypothetical protein